MNEEKTVTEEVSLTEEQANSIKAEAEKVKSEKITEATKAVKEEVNQELSSLKQELESLKTQAEAAERKRAEEKEAERLRAAIEAEKARLSEPVKKIVVPETSNPIVETPKQAPVAKMSPEEEWGLFEQNFSRVSVTLKDD